MSRDGGMTTREHSDGWGKKRKTAKKKKKEVRLKGKSKEEKK